jgi:hypothetical protein
MRRLSVIATLAVMILLPAVARAGLAAKCRKACKPFVAECRAVTSQSKRACKKLFIPACKLEGLQVCTSTTTTTPTSGSGGSTTTTTLPSSETGGGVMFMRIQDVAQEPAADGLELFTFTISIEYGIVTADAVKQIPLDPASFTVRDDDTDAVYPSEPAGAPGDCAATMVLALEDEPITCTLRFLLPPLLGQPSPVDGGAHSYLVFVASGMHASRDLLAAGSGRSSIGP